MTQKHWQSLRRQASDSRYMLFHVIWIALATLFTSLIIDYTNSLIGNLLRIAAGIWLISWLIYFFLIDKSEKEMEAPMPLAQSKGIYYYIIIALWLLVTLLQKPYLV